MNARTNIVFAVLMAMVLSLGTAARATTIPLVQGVPDITSSNNTMQYNATTDILTISGLPVSLDFNNVPPPDHAIVSALGNYLISANVNGSGVLTGGTINITGAIPTLAIPNQLLLSGNLTAFGFEDAPGGESFQFLFNVTGGALVTQFGGVGGKGGVLFESGPNTFNGTFGSGFGNVAQAGAADTFAIPTVVPVPQAAYAGLALLGLIAVRRFTCAARD